MTTLPNLPDAPADAAEGELLYVRPATGDPNAKRTFGSLWRNALGRTAASARAFFGATPIAQPAHADQAAVTTTVGAAITPTAGAAVTPTTGAAVATTGATSTTPFGFTTAAQADNLVARVNQLRVDLLASITLQTQMRQDMLDAITLLNAGRVDIIAAAKLENRIRADLVALGLLKGSA